LTEISGAAGHDSALGATSNKRTMQLKSAIKPAQAAEHEDGSFSRCARVRVERGMSGLKRTQEQVRIRGEAV